VSRSLYTGERVHLYPLIRRLGGHQIHSKPDWRRDKPLIIDSIQTLLLPSPSPVITLNILSQFPKKERADKLFNLNIVNRYIGVQVLIMQSALKVAEQISLSVLRK
jgi:hypothetical protein